MIRKKIELKNIKIIDYCNMLRSGSDKDEISEINNLLTEAIGNFTGGFDIALFMLQKDLLVFQCKFAIAMFEFDSEKAKKIQVKIDELREQIEKKGNKSEKSNPYKSFLSWILAVEKYLGFSIDRNNDLLYFTEATSQMLNHYETQKQQYENNKVKK